MLSARSVLSALATICLSVTLCFAQEKTAASKNTQDQVAQVERDWLAADAKGDIDSLNRIIADDFIGSTAESGVLSKQDILLQGGGPGGFAAQPLAKPMCAFLGIPAS